MYEAEGCSCQEISDVLPGRSRCSVIGIIDRHGFKRPEPAPLTPEEKADRKRRQKAQQMRRYRERAKEKATGKPKPGKPPRAKFVPVLIEKSLGIDLMDLTATSCRYAVTSQSPHRFCGLTATHGSWCEAHFHVCHNPPPEARDEQEAA